MKKLLAISAIMGSLTGYGIYKIEPYMAEAFKNYQVRGCESLAQDGHSVSEVYDCLDEVEFVEI